MPTRRDALMASAAALAALAGAALLRARPTRAGVADSLGRGDAYWRQRLTPEQYAVHSSCQPLRTFCRKMPCS